MKKSQKFYAMQGEKSNQRNMLIKHQVMDGF